MDGRGKSVKKDEDASSAFLATDDAFFDDLFGASPAPGVKFQPKFKPRPKGAPVKSPVKSELLPVKPEPKIDDVSGKPEQSSDIPINDSSPMDVDILPETQDKPYCSAGGGNRVVREIDVYFNPSPIEPNSLLYVTQYPLRPCWRPYDLNEMCDGVRVKPNHSKLEIAVLLDVECDNYDTEVEDHLKIKKQVLSSTRAPFATSYAVGYLIGTKLHLNPVDAVVQLRPSMVYMHGHQDLETKNAIVESDGTNKNENAAGPSKHSMAIKKGESGPDVAQTERPSPYELMKREEDSEAWISLNYLAADSPSSYRYRQKLVSADVYPTHTPMNVDGYINALVPGRPTSSLQGQSNLDGTTNKIVGSADAHGWKYWFGRWCLAEKCQVSRFSDIVRLAHGSTEEDILQALQKDAHLLQGLWIPKSKFRYEGIYAALRDYILLMFHKKGAIDFRDEELMNIARDTKDSPKLLKVILSPLALQRPRSDTWVLNKPTDRSFIENHPETVEEQRQTWSASEKDITACMSSFIKSNTVNPAVGSRKSVPGQNDRRLPSIRSEPSIKSEHNVGQASASTPTPQISNMPSDVKEALPKVLREVFLKYNVCSLQLVRQGLREMAVSKATHPKHNSKLVIAAAQSASSAPNSDLQSLLSEIAVEIHGVYVLKSLNDPCDDFRNFVINLLRTQGPKSRLKKKEISVAFEMHRKVEVSKPIYNKVMSELCSSDGNSWVLKPGDGKPQ